MDRDFQQLRGEVLDGKLRLDTIIGTGDKCVLFCGTHLLLNNRMVAVKVFSSRDAEYIAQTSKHNLRESQHLQKMLTTGTVGDIGYAVFELNRSLSAAELVEAYSLRSVSGDYVQLLAANAAARRRREMIKVGAAVLCIVTIAFGGMGYAHWKQKQSEDALLERAELAQRLESLIKEHGGLTWADAPLLNQLASTCDVLNEPIKPEERATFQSVVDGAVVLAGAIEQTDPEAMAKLRDNELHIAATPGFLDPQAMHDRVFLALYGLAGRHMVDPINRSVEFYLSKCSPSDELVADMQCWRARWLGRCAKYDDAEKLFHTYLNTAVKTNGNHLIAYAMEARWMDDEKRQEEYLRKAIKWADEVDVNDLKTGAAPMLQTFHDMSLMAQVDPNCYAYGQKIFEKLRPVMLAHGPAVIDGFKHYKLNDEDLNWEMMEFYSHGAEDYQQDGKYDQALANWKLAQKYIQPGWPFEKDVAKPAEGIRTILDLRQSQRPSPIKS